MANLAVVMAQAGDRVILVDGDLRRPQQHEIFGLHNQPGLSTWLAGAGPAPLQATGVEGLQLLVAGLPPANPVALLRRPAPIRATLEELERPGETMCCAMRRLSWGVTDAALWASRVDGVVLFVSAGSTNRDHAQRAKAVLEKVHAHIVGAVLLNAERGSAMCRVLF